MKLSEHTIKILKNLAGVNQSILIRPGSVLSTVSNAGDMLAEANIEETFPYEIPLYDIVEFLNTLKLFNSPMLDFSDVEYNYMNIYEKDDSNFKVRYTFAKKKTIEYPKKRVVLESMDIIFNLDNNTRESIIKSANVMQLPHLIIIPTKTNDSVTLEVTDIRNKSSNKFSVTIKAEIPTPCKFRTVIKMENFKIYPVEYKVCVSGNANASFESDVIDYYVGLDINSQFNFI